MMENNERTRDNSSDSDTSEWAIIDENVSLEWNDEAKYHFRHIHENSINELDQVLLHDCNTDTSDEDSIEVVSNVASDDMKDDLDNNECIRCSEDTENDLQADGDSPHDLPGMVWYRPHYGPSEEQTLNKDENTDHGSKVKVVKKKTNVVNLSDNWDLIAILLVALIGGLVFGYFVGCCQDGALPSRLLLSRLEREVKLQRYKLRNAYICLRHPSNCQILPMSDVNFMTLSPPMSDVNSMTLSPYIKPQPPFIAEHKLPLHLNPIVGNQDQIIKRLDDFEQSAITNEPEDINIVVIDMEENEDNHNIVVESPLVAETEEFQQHNPIRNIPEINQTDVLKVGINMISSLLLTNETFPQVTKLYSNLGFLKKIDLSLQVLDSIHVQSMTSRVKIDKFKLHMQKIWKKLVKKLEKSVNKCVAYISNKLDKSKAVLLKQFCKQPSVMSTKGSNMQTWPPGTVFDECNLTKQNLGEREYKHKFGTQSEVKSERSSVDKTTFNVPVVGPEGNTDQHKFVPVVGPEGNTDQHKFVVSNKREQKQKLSKEALFERDSKIVNKVRNRKAGIENNFVREKQIRRTTKVENEGKYLKKKMKENEIKSNVDLPNNENRKFQHSESGFTDKAIPGVNFDKTIGKIKTRKDTWSAPQIKMEKSKEILESDVKMSNISGYWLIKMGNGRAEQRHEEQRSDWLFQRSESRKCHRGNKDCKDFFNSNDIPMECDYNYKAKDDTNKKRKHWLRKVIPKPIVAAAKRVKNAFTEFQQNIHQKFHRQ